MKHYLIALFLGCSMLCVAQVIPNPNPIPIGYTGTITLTFDPTTGTGGMAKATACYSHIGLITSSSKNISDWRYVKPGGWGTTSEPAWTKTPDGKWTLTINNMYTYFGCPQSESITALVMVFHNGKGSSSLEGKSSTTANGDILVYIGKETKKDIWENFVPATVTKQARPTGIVNGIYYGEDGTSVTLCTYAASKTAPAQHVFLLGDMTDWELNNAYQLKQDGNYFWITLTGLTKGKEYRFQYAIIRADGVKKQISDLYSEKVLSQEDEGEPRQVDSTLISYPMSGASGYVSVLQTDKKPFPWSNATLHFQRPNKNNLIIYELWIYDHTDSHCLAGLLEEKQLDYLQNLGVNCVELMPVNEFDGNNSWGYCPNHYFALDKAYGKPEQLKTFVDECHKRGIAVVLDMVFNHATGNNPMNKLYPYGTDLAHNPWFNVSAPHPDNVYEDWNHDFEPAHTMFKRVVQYWLTEYKVDGYRFDLSHGLCGPSYNAVTNLMDYYQAMQGVSNGAYLMLEHWGSSMSSDRPKLVSAGMLCWQNTCHAFEQTAMGWLKDNDAFTDANKDGYVSYCENHDEERCFFKAKQWGNGTLSTNAVERIARVPLNVGFQCMLNGPQLFYHYAELGYDLSKYQKSDGSWGKDGYDAYGEEVVSKYVNEEAKMQPKATPQQLGWLQDSCRMAAYRRVAQTIQLRTRLLPTVFEGNPSFSSVASGTAIRYVQWGGDVLAVGNFSVTTAQKYTLPKGKGVWYDYLEGGTKAVATYTLQPGEWKIFTGTSLQPDPIVTDLKNTTEVLMSAPLKVIKNGRLLIWRSNGVAMDILGNQVH